MTPDSQSPGEQHVRSQQILVDFLQSDLDLCFTMLNTAEIASEPEHTRSALQHVNDGLLTIRKLSGRIEDPEVWKLVHDRSDELEKALELFKDR